MTKSCITIKTLRVHRAVSSALIGVSLWIAAPSWADYNPTLPSAPSSPTTNTGRRGGCLGESVAELTALAPKSHVGQTVSSHPTFVWYIPEEQPTPLEFSLYDISETGQRQLVYKTELTSMPGLMSLSLPGDQAGLESGRQYLWQVVLLCNPNRPSSALVTSAELERIAMPPTLVGQLDQLQSAQYTDLDSYYQQQSDLYVGAGIWYDALSVLLQQSPASRDSAVLSLLDELASYEAAQNMSNESLQTVIQVLQGGS